MKRLQLILFLLIMFLVPNVYCAEFNMNNYTSATKNGTKNRYQGTEIYNSGGNFTYTFGNRYNGRLSEIETYFDYPFEANTTYRFTYNMATNDFNNNFGSSYWWDCEHDSSATVFIPTYVSYKKVQYSITPIENTTCIRVSVRGKNLSTGNITQISNWNLSNITLYDPDYQSGSGGGQGTTPTPTSSPGASNQDIINNQNNNTQDVINNQNENTSNIIENNNQNTQDIINTQNELLGDCVKNLMDDNLILSLENVTQNGNSFTQINADTNPTLVLMSQGYNSITYYDTLARTDITNTGYYTLSFTKTSSFNIIYYKLNGYIYDTGIKIDVSSLENGKTYYIKSEFTNTTQGSIKFRNLMITDKNIDGFIAWGSQFCTSKLDQTTNAINQQNNYIMDNSDPSISDNDFLNTFNSIGVSDPLSYLLTLPTQLINKIVSLSGSCSPINLGSLYGTMLTLPCINIENFVGSSVWSIIDVIFSVSLLVVILKNLYDTFSNLLTMGAEKEAKEKFSMPTPMDFLSMILGGDR